MVRLSRRVRTVLYCCLLFGLLLVPAPARAAPAAASIAIDPNAALGPVAPAIAGANLSAAWRCYVLDCGTGQIQPTALARIKGLGLRSLRFPTYLPPDFYMWADPNLAAQKKLTTAEFLRLARALGAEPVITVNIFFKSFPGRSDEERIATAADYAAGWVRAVNFGELKGIGPRVRYWQIGNEPYLDGFYPCAGSGCQPIPQWAAILRAFSAAMKAVDPNILLVAPSHFRPDDANWRATLQADAGTFDAVSDHFYNTDADDGRAGDPLAWDEATWPKVLESYRRWFPDKPLLVTEFNLWCWDHPGSNYKAYHPALETAANALSLVDSYRRFASAGVAAAQHWQLFGGLSDERARGGPADKCALLDLNNALAPSVQATAFQLLAHMPAGEAQLLASRSSLANLRVVALQRAGRVYLLALNAGEAAVDLSLTLGEGYRPVQQRSWELSSEGGWGVKPGAIAGAEMPFAYRPGRGLPGRAAVLIEFSAHPLGWPPRAPLLAFD